MQVDTMAKSLFFASTLLVVTLKDGEIGYGTGFIFNAAAHPRLDPILITASHVLTDGAKIDAEFVRRGQDGQPVYGETLSITVTDLDERVVHLPGADLCGMRLGADLQEASADGFAYFAAPGRGQYPTDEELAAIDPGEHVVFVGYPDGQYDTTNKTSIARQAIVSTPVQLDYRGTPVFLIDGNIIEGSSGSPVYQLQNPIRRSVNGKFGLQPFSRMLFLGILTQVHDTVVVAEVEMAGTTQPKVSFRPPIGLGTVVKYSAVQELIELIFERGSGRA